jgi:hypothetical protein
MEQRLVFHNICPFAHVLKDWTMFLLLEAFMVALHGASKVPKGMVDSKGTKGFCNS